MALQLSEYVSHSTKSREKLFFHFQRLMPLCSQETNYLPKPFVVRSRQITNYLTGQSRQGSNYLTGQSRQRSNYLTGLSRQIAFP